jgi:hypothetical protein
MKIDRTVLALGMVLLYALSLYFHDYQRASVSFYDAAHYRHLAEQILQFGLDDFNQELRTFGYPWLLSLVVGPAAALGLPIGLSVCLVQTTLYFAVVLVVAERVALGARSRVVLYLALCGNILLIPYLGITLTDGVFTTIALLVLVLMTTTEAKTAPFPTVAAVLLLTGFAVVIRPAALWLAVPVAVWSGLGLTRESWRRFLPALVLGLVPLAVQIRLNLIHHGVFSFLPTLNIGQLQIKWGIKSLKYATVMGQAKPRDFYRTPSWIDVSDAEAGLGWYAAHPLDAAMLLGIKFFGGFDWEYLLPYPQEPTPLSWVLSLGTYSVLYWGLVGAVLHAATGRVPALGSRFLPAAAVLAWVAFTLPTAIEQRFTLPILVYLLVVVTCLFDRRAAFSRRTQGWLVGGHVLFLAVALAIAGLVRAQQVRPLL